MSIDALSCELNDLSMDRVLRHQDSDDVGHQDRERLTRKSSTSSTGSTLEKRKMFYRKDSEVKIEAIFKELFSPDAKIIDHFEGDCVMIPGLESIDIEEQEVITNHDRFKLRRQTSLIPKEESKKGPSAGFQPRIRVMPARKSPAPLRKESTPTLRKRSTSAKAPLPKFSAPPSLRPNFVTVPDEGGVASYLRKNAIPLRRGITQK